MSKKNQMRKALITSAVAFTLSVSSFVGTTFAWFTDSVTSGNNRIVAGSLQVDLELLDAKTGSWSSLKANRNPIYTYTNWEPGHTDVKILRVENEGTLALKWKAKFVSEAELTKLANVIDVYVNPSVTELSYPVDRSLVGYTKVGTLAEFINTLSTTTYGTLAAGEKAYLGLALQMQTSAGNEYQGLDLGGFFDIQIVAAQLMAEDDSFGNDFDADAPYPIVPYNPVATTEEFLERLESAEAGDEIFLTEGEFEITQPLAIPSGVTIYGAQAGNPAINWANNQAADKTVISYTGNGNCVNIQQGSGMVLSDIVIDGVMIDGNTTADKGIYVKKSSGNALEGIKILNTAIVNTKNDGIDATNTCGAVIENNYVSNVVDNAILLASYKGVNQAGEKVTAYVRNNYVDGISSTTNGAIMVKNGAGDVVVSGNIVKNVSDNPSDNSKAGGISLYDLYEGGVIIVENNQLENVMRGINLYKISNIDEGNTVCVIVRNNTIREFTAFGIGTNELNVKKKKHTGVTITDNKIISQIIDNALLVKAGTGRDWKVTASGNTLNGVVVNSANGVFEG